MSYFKESEFNCHDGTPVPENLKGNLRLLIQNLDVLRESLGVPVRVLSGYRSPAHNAAVGGKPQSKHMAAMAADIVTKEFSPRQIHARIEKLIAEKKMRQGGLGLYKGFVHYDVRGTRARWQG